MPTARTGHARPKEGQDRPRWRAKLKHHDDEKGRQGVEPHERLDAWIDERGWRSAELETVESLDLTSYLRATASIGLTSTERLRKLAMALEPTMSLSDQPRGWLALERIYAAGVALCPDDADIEISRALTAESCASSARDDAEVRRRMILAGRRAVARALELRPTDPAAHHAQGMLDYSFDDGSIEAALAAFERAIALDPAHGWSRLYRAHCLHDLERWSDAATAYADVDPSFLTGASAWRYDLLREQRAWCLLQAGDRERALAELLALLHRYETQPRLAQFQLLRELTAGAEGSLHAELGERLDRLRRVVDGLRG
jgi:tetratricopeptide (TPR) repeat protein